MLGKNLLDFFKFFFLINIYFVELQRGKNLLRNQFFKEILIPLCN